MTPADLSRHERDWNAIAELDPKWAVLSTPEGKYGRWDDGEFFATGEREIDDLMAVAAELGHPRDRARALDFGCGLGRTTRALAARFEDCVGVDVSDEMVRRARELNASVDNCSFVVNTRDDLALFESASFDLAYSNIVLQHLPDAATALAYLRELARVLRPGGLMAFQLPTAVPLKVRVQPRRTVYRLLRTLGASPRFLYWRLGLHPISMLAVPEHEVRSLLAVAGADVLRVDSARDPQFGFTSASYYAGRS